MRELYNELTCITNFGGSKHIVIKAFDCGGRSLFSFFFFFFDDPCYEVPKRGSMQSGTTVSTCSSAMYTVTMATVAKAENT